MINVTKAKLTASKSMTPICLTVHSTARFRGRPARLGKCAPFLVLTTAPGPRTEVTWPSPNGPRSQWINGGISIRSGGP